MGINPAPANEAVNPLFTWTANWIDTFDGGKEDIVVMVNTATRVPIYGADQPQGMADKMTAAIRNTLLTFSMNLAMIDEYSLQAGGACVHF